MNKNIDTFANKYPRRDYVITIKNPEYTSVCPLTGNLQLNSGFRISLFAAL